MAKIRLTKGELKRQRDALVRYQRYLPTLQLKKQQLQMEIVNKIHVLNEKKTSETSKINAIKTWVTLLTDESIDMAAWIKPISVITATKNIAGINLPEFEHVEFGKVEYDLFAAPLWVDNAIDGLRSLVSIMEEAAIVTKAIGILRRELRITTQRVNLFEKVKIPEAEEAIRRIKIYIGDQMTNAVGRSKMAKKKIEKAFLEIAGVEP
jgi:V/A-type H+/Na+-transporting ATPase subunit D